MRIFRNEEAARKAGISNTAQIKSYGAIILTDRERALLEALEKVTPVARELSDRDDDEDAAIEAAEALLKSMNVEG